MAFRLSRVVHASFDLIASLKYVEPSVRAQILSLKKTQDELKRKIVAAQTFEPIDWNKYAKVIQAPGLVETYKKEYEAFKTPEIDIKSTLDKLNQAEQISLAAAQKATEEGKKELEALQMQLRELENAIPYDELTVKQTWDANPQWHAKIEKDIQEDKWA